MKIKNLQSSTYAEGGSVQDADYQTRYLLSNYGYKGDKGTEIEVVDIKGDVILGNPKGSMLTDFQKEMLPYEYEIKDTSVLPVLAKGGELKVGSFVMYQTPNMDKPSKVKIKKILVDDKDGRRSFITSKGVIGEEYTTYAKGGKIGEVVNFYDDELAMDSTGKIISIEQYDEDIHEEEGDIYTIEFIDEEGNKRQSEINQYEVFKRGGSIYAEGGSVDGYNIDNVVSHYVDTMLFSSNDEDNEDAEYLDDMYDRDDVDERFKKVSATKIKEFITKNKSILKKHKISEESLGSDLWYTPNGHGVGFWDRGYGGDGDKLSKSSEEIMGKYLSPYSQYGKVSVDGVKYAKGGSVDGEYEIYLKGWSVEQVEDSWEEGETGEVVGYHSASVGKKFGSKKELYKYVEEDITYQDANALHFIYMGDGDLRTDVLVNEDNDPASLSEIASWKKGDKRLYNAHYVLDLEVSKKVKSLSDEEVAKVLGAETYFKKGGKIKDGYIRKDRFIKLQRELKKVSGKLKKSKGRERSINKEWEKSNVENRECSETLDKAIDSASETRNTTRSQDKEAMIYGGLLGIALGIFLNR